MTTEELIRGPIIPILVTAGFLYITIRVVLLKDLSILTKDPHRKYKDKEAFLKQAGRLMIFMTVVSAGMTILTFFSEPASMILFFAGFIVFIVLWKKMNDDFGA